MNKGFAPHFVVSFLTLSEYSPELRLDRLEMIKIISQLPIIDCLFLLSRIDMALNCSNVDILDKGNQSKIIDILFNKQPGILLKRLLQSRDNAVIFHSQQIYLCMGYLLTYGTKRTEPVTKYLCNKLGHVLLYLNEFFNEEIIGPKDVQNTKALGMLWQIGQFSLSIDVDLGSELSRSYMVFNDTPEGAIFSTKFHEATGVQLKKFWAIIFSLWGKWWTTASEFIPKNVVLEGNSFFSNCPSLQADEVNRSIRLLSSDVDAMKGIHKRRLESFNQELVNFEFLREKPLLEFEPKRYICLSFPYLVMMGTRWILELVRTQIGQDRYNKELGQSLGDAYEAYVRTLVERAYPLRSPSPFAGRAFYRSNNGIQICDGIIDYGDSLIFYEVKAISIEKRYRLSRSLKDVESALRHFLIKKGAKQLNMRIEDFKNGKVEIPEIQPERIKKYWPILISCIENIPHFGTLSNYYSEIMIKNNILQQPDVGPLNILSLKEIEHIMELVREGHSFVDLLEDKTSSQANREMSFWNYLTTNTRKRSTALNRPKHLNDKLNILITELKEELGLSGST